jgi:hypothetical protein
MRTPSADLLRRGVGPQAHAVADDRLRVLQLAQPVGDRVTRHLQPGGLRGDAGARVLAQPRDPFAIDIVHGS